MQRRREIAASPQRSAPESWEALTCLIRDSVGRSEEIGEAEVEGALVKASGVGMALIAGGHLDRHPITVVAGDLHLSLTTVSGDPALGLEENLGAVMGATKATSWKVYLPTPEPLAAAVRAAAGTDANLSAEEPPAKTSKAAEAGAGLLDTEALRRGLG